MELLLVGAIAISVFAAFIGLFHLRRALSEVRDMTRALGNLASNIAPSASKRQNSDVVRSQDEPQTAPPAVPRRMMHDLNNAIGTITGFADAALEDLGKASPVCGDLLEIQEAARKAKSIVKELDGLLKNGEKKQGGIETSGDPRSEVSSAPNKDCESRAEHLLIVDDEVQLLRMFRRFFEPIGYRVTTFSDALKAREDFEKQPASYDLAIVDQRMPELSGLSLAEAMLSVRSDIPIILLSGYSDPLKPEEALRAGIRKFLSKPIPQSELSATVRRILDDRKNIPVR